MSDILINNLSLQLSGGRNIFSGLSFSLRMEKTGLVGDNGVGKSTLLKLINKDIIPNSGSIFCDISVGYLPQDYYTGLNEIVGQVLDFNDKNTVAAMKYLKIGDIDYDRSLESLSGGEKIKILLAGILSQKPDYIILDEPTNNLDAEAREIVYNFVTKWKKGMLIVSHDRSLLNLMDNILDLNSHGIKSYGGNYDYYIEQKEIERQALERQVMSAEQIHHKAKQREQRTKEKQQKRAVRGEGNRKTIGMGGAMLDKMRDTSQKTASRLVGSHEKKVEQTKSTLDTIKQKMVQKNEFSLDLSGTSVPASKLVVKITNLSFSYGDKKIFDNFDFVLYGPSRVAFMGRNGSGKTTLVKLIMGQLLPSAGEIKIGVNKLAYLDQNVSFLDKNETLLNSLLLISKLDEGSAKEWLAHFLFYGLDVYKKIGELSGGERVRAALACVLAGVEPPQLLILDEPTNNLDISSIRRIEVALQNYRGALIVISHDQNFLAAVGVDETIV